MNPRQHERILARLDGLPRRTFQIGAVGDRKMIEVIELAAAKAVVTEEQLADSATLEIMLGLRALQARGGELRFPGGVHGCRYAVKFPDGPAIYGESVEEVLGLAARIEGGAAS